MAEQGLALGDLLSVRAGRSLPISKVGSAGPFLLGMGIFDVNGGFRVHKLRRYGGPYPEAAVARPGDVLLCITDLGTPPRILGRSARVPSDLGNLVLFPGEIGKVDWRVADPDSMAYGYWVMRTVAFRDYCLRFARGTAIRRVRPEDVELFPIRDPRKPQLRRLTRTLDAIEGKIRINREMNQTLEQLVRALFKSWFVDFDPVRAKATGRWKQGESLPGMPADMWDHWPSELEETEIGEMPRGWTVGGLGDVASCTRDLVDPSEVDPEVRYVGLEHITPKSLTLWHWGRVGDTVSGKARFKRGELLFGRLRPYFHKVCAPSFGGVASTDILTVAPKSPDWFGFVLGHLDSSALVDYATARSNGTKMPRTSWGDLARWQLALPPADLARSLSSTLRPLLSKMGGAAEESTMLGETRDALLPRLLSGEIRVPVGGGT